jgi:hypothetical protein
MGNRILTEETPTTVGAKPDRPPATPERTLLDSIGAARRFVAAFVTRTRRGEGGLAELTAVVEMRNELDLAIDAIARHLLEHDDCSYKQIGIALDITQQAAAKRYRGASSRRAGGQPSWLR